MGSYFSKFRDYSRNAWSGLQHWTLRLFDFFEWAVRFIVTIHQAIASLVVTIAAIVPLVGLLIEALGLLASPIMRAISPSNPKPLNRIAIGLKVLTATIMLGCVVVGFLFPPVGLSMVVVGLCAGAIHQVYKTYRTSSKYFKALSGDNSELSNDVEEYERKLKSRGVSLALSCVNIALLTATLVVPPIAIVTLPTLFVVNLGFAIYQYTMHSSTNKGAMPSDIPEEVNVSANDTIDDASIQSADQVDDTPISDDANSLALVSEPIESFPLTLPETRSIPSVTNWSSSMVFAVGSMYAIAGCFDLVIVMAAVFFTTFKLSQRPSCRTTNSKESEKNNATSSSDIIEQVTSKRDPSVDNSDTTSHESEHSSEDHTSHQASVNHFLHTMDRGMTPTTPTTYAQCHSHGSLSEASEETTTETVASSSIDRFLNDEVHVLTHHNLPKPINHEKDSQDDLHAEEQVGMS